MKYLLQNEHDPYPLKDHGWNSRPDSNFSLFPHQGSAVNDEACKIAQEVANEGNALVTGGVSQTPNYLSGSGKEAVQEQFRKQAEVFIKNDVDFLLAEVS